jgi:hypothetical protein
MLQTVSAGSSVMLVTLAKPKLLPRRVTTVPPAVLQLAGVTLLMTGAA